MNEIFFWFDVDDLDRGYVITKIREYSEFSEDDELHEMVSEFDEHENDEAYIDTLVANIVHHIQAIELRDQRVNLTIDVNLGEKGAELIVEKKYLYGDEFEIYVKSGRSYTVENGCKTYYNLSENAVWHLFSHVDFAVR
jgi:hypothetical protein